MLTGKARSNRHSAASHAHASGRGASGSAAAGHAPFRDGDPRWQGSRHARREWMHGGSAYRAGGGMMDGVDDRMKDRFIVFVGVLVRIRLVEQLISFCSSSAYARSLDPGNRLRTLHIHGPV